MFSTRQGGEGLLMVWGAFYGKDLSESAFTVDNQNATLYTKTLGDYLLPFSARVYYGD